MNGKGTFTGKSPTRSSSTIEDGRCSTAESETLFFKLSGTPALSRRKVRGGRGRLYMRCAIHSPFSVYSPGIAPERTCARRCRTYRFTWGTSEW